MPNERATIGFYVAKKDATDADKARDPFRRAALCRAERQESFEM